MFFENIYIDLYYTYIYIYMYTYKFAGPSAQRRVGILSGLSCCQNDASFLLYRDPSGLETSRHRIIEVTLATLWRSKARFLLIFAAEKRH